MAVRSKHAAHPRSKASIPPKVKLVYGGAAVVAILAAALLGVHVVTAGAPPVPEGAVASYAGSLELNATGAQLASWNQTSSFCPEVSWGVPDGTVSTDSAGNATLTTTGKTGSCAAIISPGAYSSGVVEADIDFPALPGKPGTVANWTAFWLTNQAKWPVDGEIDAVETEPATGVNAVSYHWGTPGKPLEASTDGFAPDGKIAAAGPNLTPGWHIVDVVFTKGFFAVYYDGKEFASSRSSVITGSSLNILLNSSVTPSTKAVEKSIGGKPKNSDSSPATVAIKYLKVWSYNG
jgi:Glycosyl hydrolases family 16